MGPGCSRPAAARTARPRVQVLERTLPDSGSGLAEWWAEHGRADGSWTSNTYAELIDRAGPARGTARDPLGRAQSPAPPRPARSRTAGGGMKGTAAVCDGR